jgi:hypothetical protein
MARYIVYSDDEVTVCSDWSDAKKLAKGLSDVNCKFYAVRILNAEEEKEFAWKWVSKLYEYLGIIITEPEMRKQFLELWKENKDGKI